MTRNIKLSICFFMIMCVFTMTSSVCFAESQTYERQKLAKICGDMGTGYTSEAPNPFSGSDKVPVNTTVIKLDTVEELMGEGLSFDEASTLIDIQEITEKMKSSGQRLEAKNGKTFVTEPSGDNLSISQDDIQRITQLADDQLEKPHIDNKDKIAKINDLIAKNPQKSYFREEFADGSWIEVIVDDGRDIRNTSNKVDRSDREEVETIDIYGENGSRTRSFIWRQADLTHYCQMKLQYTYNVANNNHVVRLTGLNQLLIHSGIFEILKLRMRIKVTNLENSIKSRNQPRTFS